MTTVSHCAYMFDTGERCPVAITANGYCDAHQHAAAPTVASLFPEPEFKYATPEQRDDPSYAKDSVGHVLDWGDEMTCMCCGATGHVRPLTPEEIKWDEGWDFDGSQWVRAPKWICELRDKLDRARAAETKLRADNDALRTLARRLRAWVDRDEVRLTTMAVNSPVWEELAEIDHEMCRLGVVEE